MMIHALAPPSPAAYCDRSTAGGFRRVEAPEGGPGSVRGAVNRQEGGSKEYLDSIHMKQGAGTRSDHVPKPWLV